MKLRVPRSATTVPPLLLLLLVTTVSCSWAPDGADGRPGADLVTHFAQSEREPVGNITGTLLDGSSYDSRDLLGQLVVYNVWGSWCPPCREEAPVLRRVASETRDEGVRFIGINVRDNDTAARAFERTYDIDYPSITTDSSSGALLAFGPALPRSAVPSTLIVDREGRLAARVIGPVTYSTLTGLLTGLMSTAHGRAP